MPLFSIFITFFIETASPLFRFHFSRHHARVILMLFRFLLHIVVIAFAVF